MQMSGLLNGVGENYTCLDKPYVSLSIKWYKNSKECQTFYPSLLSYPLGLFVLFYFFFTIQSDFQTFRSQKIKVWSSLGTNSFISLMKL